MLELQGIQKSFSGVPAVDGVDLRVERGETLALIGPSGCGKSTLLRLIVGLLWPDSGTVRVADRIVDRENVLSVRRSLGYVIQSGGLFPHLTARGNVALLPHHLGWTDERIRDRLAELTALVRLDESLLERYPAQLSGGQRQRVSLMRALALDPEMLLLDEPLGALDPMIRAELQEELREIFRRLEKTVVLVTHDLVEAGFFASRVVLMRSGKIAQQGTYSDFRDRPADDFVRRFFDAQRRPEHLQ